MPKSKTATAPATGSIYDQIVADAVAKSIIVPPSDPNGGARLPRRQRGQPGRKKADGEDYMAIFDREAQESDDQLDDWMRYTQAVIDSPDDFVNDDDDTPEDPDEQDEDSRDAPAYDPYTDDDGHNAVEDLTEGEAYASTTVRGHKRRKPLRKSAGDHTAEFDALSNDHDDDDDDDDDEGDEDTRAAAKKAAAVKKAAKLKKAAAIAKAQQPDDDDDLDEDDDDPEDSDSEARNTDDEDEDTTHGRRNAAERAKLDKSRRGRVRKALGRDAFEIVEGNDFAKALTDAVYDLRDDLLGAVVASNRVLRRENRVLATRVSQMEKAFRTVLQGELGAVTKSLASVVVPAAPAAPLGYDAPVRKGYGAPVATQTRFPAAFDADRALDAIEKALEGGTDGVTPVDLTLLEGNRTPDGLSAGAVTVLRRERLL